MRKNISFEDIERQFRGVKGYDGINPEHNYHKSYRYFVDYFKGLDKIEESHFVIAANFTYGWMPTILNFKPSSDAEELEFSDVLILLNKAKQSKRLSDKEIFKVKTLVNNSMVGTSKLLHFINPEVYAIWDSRVCRFAKENYSNYQVEKVNNFKNYLKLCGSLTEHPDFSIAHEEFKSRLSYEVSPMRVIETIMFRLGQELIKDDREKLKG